MSAGNRIKLLAVALLSVLAVVGVLAGGALRRGEKDALKTELTQIQLAVTAMMLDNGITRLPHPVTEPTQDMGRFPDFLTSPEEKGMLEGDGPGYLLYGHDKIPDGKADSTVDYLSFPRARWSYTVAEDGTVGQ